MNEPHTVHTMVAHTVYDYTHWYCYLSLRPMISQFDSFFIWRVLQFPLHCIASNSWLAILMKTAWQFQPSHSLCGNIAVEYDTCCQNMKVYRINFELIICVYPRVGVDYAVFLIAIIPFYFSTHISCLLNILWLESIWVWSFFIGVLDFNLLYHVHVYVIRKYC